MDVPVEGGTEAVDEAHRPEAGLRAGAVALAQMGIDDSQQDVQDDGNGLGLALQVPAQALRHRQDPLAHGQRREDVIDQARHGLCPSCNARRMAETAAFAGERNEKIMPTVRAAGACKTVGKDAAFEVAAELAFHIGRHAQPVPVVFTRECEVGLQVLLDDLVEGGLLGMAATIRGKSASL
jgi:hypothetical protein